MQRFVKRIPHYAQARCDLKINIIQYPKMYNSLCQQIKPYDYNN